ncbi:MAG: biotin--[acetyl-CoA-carboxylase] ligase [Clostridiales bacterium]|nr:biotin--[acetyl-CoA-carboxylase] ligase [Clostridiales bacterium]
MNIVTLPQVDSTSSYLRQSLPDAPAGTVITTPCQQAGRGQRGNSWEAEPGMNLTFSIMLRPTGIKASGQYAISEAVALAVLDTLAPLVPDSARLAVKWPNDIYYGDDKICGILIENTLRGDTILKSVAGVGVNINQRRFLSDAPNPVSLFQITGREYPLEPLLATMAAAIEKNVELVATADGHACIAARYRASLWRREGLHPYRLPDGTRFLARIEEIAPDGMLVLRHGDNTLSSHAFKEVAAVLNDL